MIAEILPKVAGMNEARQSKWRPRPSSAGPERCLRQMVYHGLNTPAAPIPGRAILVMDDSSWHEELTRDWINKTAFRVHSDQMHVNFYIGKEDVFPERSCPRCEATIPAGYVGGHIDGVVTDVLGIDRLMEHKAINHFTFQRFWSGGEVPEDYLTQTAIYTKGLQDDNPNIREALLLVKNKNTAQYLEYLCDYDKDRDALLVSKRVLSTGEVVEIDLLIENIIGDAVRKFHMAMDYIDRQTLPKRQYDFDHWRCEYCQYNRTCWGEYEKEFDDLKTGVMMPEDVADMVRYYKETSAQVTDMEKEKKDLREKIVAVMEETGAREGKAGEYIVERKLIHGKRLDKKLVPPQILEEASTHYQQLRLNIRKIVAE